MITFFEIEGDLHETLEDAQKVAKNVTTGYITEYDDADFDSFDEVCAEFEKRREDGESIVDALSFARKINVTHN